MSTCTECDMPQIWAGMDWHPHSAEQHAGTRRRLNRAVLRVLAERAAAESGHRVTIRFAQTTAWAECSCGWRGLNWPDSSYARGDGHDHLADCGRMVVDLALLQAAS